MRDSKGRFVKGHETWNTDKKGVYSKESKKKMSESAKKSYKNGRTATKYWSGKKMPTIVKEKMSEAQKKAYSEGRRNHTFTEEHWELLKEKHKGKRFSPNTEFKKGQTPWAKDNPEWSKKIKEMWEDPQYRKKVLGKRGMSSLEVKMLGIIEKHNLPFKFVGDGKFSIGRKVPDFINTNGQKLAVEVFAKQHKDQFRGGVDKWKEERSKLFKQYGWDIEYFDAMNVNEEEVLRRLG